MARGGTCLWTTEPSRVNQNDLHAFSPLEPLFVFACFVRNAIRLLAHIEHVLFVRSIPQLLFVESIRRLHVQACRCVCVLKCVKT